MVIMMMAAESTRQTSVQTCLAESQLHEQGGASASPLQIVAGSYLFEFRGGTEGFIASLRDFGAGTLRVLTIYSETPEGLGGYLQHAYCAQ